MSVITKLLLFIFRAFPPSDSIFKVPEGRAKSEYEDEKRHPIQEHFLLQSSIVEGCEILDLGSGYGGRPIAYLESGARSVVGIEVDQEKIDVSQAFTESRGENRVKFVLAVGESLPFPDQAFDTIIMNEVLEHVVSPERVLMECHRVLRPGGKLYLIFPPYYNLIGGSHLHGYATSFPGLNLIFTTDQLKSAAVELLEAQGIDYKPFFREVPTDKLWNQNGLTCSGFEELIAKIPLKTTRLIFQGHKDFRFKGYTGLQKILWYPLYLLAQAPILREIFCSRICATMERTRF